MGRVLVTGGAGFIGSHVADALVQAGREVRVLDVLLRAAHGDTPPNLPPGAEVVRGDVCDPATVEAALDGVEAISHQAAMVGLGLDLGDIADYVRNNDLGTASLLLAMHRRGFRGRLVLGSSMVVYGEGRYRCGRHGLVRPGPRAQERLEAGDFEPPCPTCRAELTPESVPEDAPTDPRNVYAATKLHQEQLCAAYARETGAPAVALRYHNVYGPRMPSDTPYAGVASVFRSAIEAGRAPRVFEDGRQLRDFVHVGDVARANILALDPETRPGVYNVATGHPRTVGEMAGMLTRTRRPDAPSPVVTGEYRLGDVRHVFASVDRIGRELGFRAEVEFEQGMQEFARAPLRAPARSSAR